MPYYYIGGEPYNSRQWSIIIVTSILVVLSTCSVALRLYARMLGSRRLYIDDILIIAALILSYGNCICEYVGVEFGLGRHAAEVGEEKALRYMLVLYVLQLFWNTTLPVIKASIILFYQRLFPTAWLKRACRYLLIFLVIWYIAFQLTAIFQCTPIWYFWDRTLEGGQCVNAINFYIALAATNTATDVVLLIIPMPIVWNLQLKTSRKIALSGIFMLGAFVCGIALYRISTLPLINNNDITWSNTYAGLWTAIEGSVGVIVACLPSLMPVWRKFWGQKATYHSNSGKLTQQGGGGKSYPSYLAGNSYRRSRSDRDGFDVLSSAPTRSPSQEAIVKTVVARGHDIHDSHDSDERDELPGGTINVVTNVYQQVELQNLPRVYT